MSWIATKSWWDDAYWSGQEVCIEPDRMTGVQLIEPLVAIVLTALVMAFVGRKNPSLPMVDQGLLHFRLPKVFVIIGVVSWLMAGGLAMGSYLVGMSSWALTIFLGVLAVAFAYMGVLLVRDGRYYKVAYNEDSLLVIDGRQRAASCLWSDIVSARLHPISKYILLRTKDGRTLKINAYVMGSDSLFSIMGEKTELPIHELVAKARAVG